ncbi:MAG: putative periplasmic serine endoprotease DegP-like precursor, partial [Pseudomonadota bacterium]
MGMHRRIFTAVMAAGLWIALAGPMPAMAQRGLPDFTDLVEKAGPAVVNIRTLERAKPRGPGAPQGPG